MGYALFRVTDFYEDTVLSEQAVLSTHGGELRVLDLSAPDKITEVVKLYDTRLVWTPAYIAAEGQKIEDGRLIPALLKIRPTMEAADAGPQCIYRGALPEPEPEPEPYPLPKPKP